MSGSAIAIKDNGNIAIAIIDNIVSIFACVDNVIFREMDALVL